jgi:hypothetical protein|tara:strand:+ start:431 stop:604 length:174 start_codon:yes stop_codon:yes gene_type:complete
MITSQENSERLDRHEKVIEKLIEKVAKLEIADNIQNFLNEVNSKSNEEDISDSSIRP